MPRKIKIADKPTKRTSVQASRLKSRIKAAAKRNAAKTKVKQAKARTKAHTKTRAGRAGLKVGKGLSKVKRVGKSVLRKGLLKTAVGRAGTVGMAGLAGYEGAKALGADKLGKKIADYAYSKTNPKEYAQLKKDTKKPSKKTKIGGKLAKGVIKAPSKKAKSATKPKIRKATIKRKAKKARKKDSLSEVKKAGGRLAYAVKTGPKNIKSRPQGMSRQEARNKAYT